MHVCVCMRVCVSIHICDDDILTPTGYSLYIYTHTHIGIYIYRVNPQTRGTQSHSTPTTFERLQPSHLA